MSRLIKKLESLLSLILIVCLGMLARNISESVRELQDAQRAAQIERQSAEAAELLPKYDARLSGKMTTIKDQGGLGTCWAVAASSALEASLLPEEQIVFSADHISMRNSFAKEQSDGGGYAMVMAYLTAWQGPIAEEADPYGDGTSPEGLAPVKHVQEIHMYQNRDIAGIKRAVVQYGAVQSALYMDLQSANAKSPYYEKRMASYCYDGREAVNHDVLIIGWDDDYPAEYFARPVVQNGAFICQNSWGTDFGEDGIFYVSYEDAHIGDTAIGYAAVEPADNYGHIYQSDLCGWIGQLGYGGSESYFANTFTSGGEELLQAVGFYATGKNTAYKIYVLEGRTEPENMLLEKPLAQGTLEAIGYYTIPLTQEVELQSTEPYTVVVYIDTPDSELPVAVEYMRDEFTKTVDILDGSGYISHNGVVWVDTEEEHNCNVCLKAYTSDRHGM
ncbi:MAG: lectin like domain-containing protein [Eubacteriales bacterium]|nr:lectin like domain-containing protein [Eubacteriales bacterium]